MAGSMLSSYVPSGITIVINHPSKNVVHVLGNYSDDSIISIEYPEEAWTETVSPDGWTNRTHRLDKTLRVTVNLNQNSMSNDVLSAMAKYDETNLDGVSGIFTCTLADKSGRSYAYSSQCYVKRPQTQEFGTSTSSRAWTIVMAWADQNIGGSGKIDADTQAVLEAFGITIDATWKI